MKLIDYLVRTLPGIGGWKDRDINIIIDNTSLVINIKGDEATGLIDSRSLEVITREQYEYALAVSQKVEWGGEDLPPLGCECEWLDKNTQKWFPVLIKYQSSWVIVIQEIKDGEEDPVELSIDVLTDKERCKFRPIRSEADKKRDEAIAAMQKRLGHAAGLVNVLNIYRAIEAGEIPHIRIE